MFISHIVESWWKQALRCNSVFLKCSVTTSELATVSFLLIVVSRPPLSCATILLIYVPICPLTVHITCKHVRYGNQLTGKIPSELRRMRNLSSLSLFKNEGLDVPHDCPLDIQGNMNYKTRAEVQKFFISLWHPSN